MLVLAVHVAKIARMRHPGHLLPAEVRACFAEMGKVAIAMGDSANQALVSHDPRTARLREEDEVVDNLHWQLLSVLLDPHWERGVPAAVDVALPRRPGGAVRQGSGPGLDQHHRRDPNAAASGCAKRGRDELS